MTKTNLTRRGALLAAAGAGLTVGACSGIEPYEAPVATGSFRHGVASGDPDQTSVVLWTALSDDGGGYRGVEVARDAQFADVVFSSGEDIRYIVAQALGTLKILASGLEPGQSYFYRFRHNDAYSPTGITRTLPVGSIENYRIGIFSCANYPAGHFNAYRHAAESGELDLVLHLGDYFYEYGMGEYATDDAEKLNRMPDPLHEILSQDDYVRRIALYRSDPDLQALHAAAPWVMAWDDHETANNTWRGGAANHNEGEGSWQERRDGAMRAWYDWMPAREPEVLHERWQSLEIGDLATIVMMESRLTARSPQITWDDCPVPVGAEVNAENTVAVHEWLDTHLGAEDREVLGPVQLDFVTTACENSVAAGKPWRILGNEVILGKIQSPDFDRTLPFWVKWIAESRGAAEFVDRSRFDIPFNFDFWNGYPAARERLFAGLKGVGADFIAVTGDSHSFWVNDLKDDSGDRVGVEFGGTSVTSPSPFKGAPGVDAGAVFEAANPDTLRLNAYDNGWMLLRLTPETAEVDFVSIDTIERRSSAASIKDSWRVRPADGGAVPRVERMT
jgi:alkaline phosphatase D